VVAVINITLAGVVLGFLNPLETEGAKITAHPAASMTQNRNPSTSSSPNPMNSMNNPYAVARQQNSEQMPIAYPYGIAMANAHPSIPEAQGVTWAPNEDPGDHTRSDR
jgi:hypothetical protein